MKREEEHHAARNLMLFVLENDDLIKYRDVGLLSVAWRQKNKESFRDCSLCIDLRVVGIGE